MSLLALREAIVADIRAGLPSLKHCEDHGGRFDAKELQRVATRAPAVFVAALGVRDITDNVDGPAATLTWGAFVVTRDAPGTPRDAAALAIVDALLHRIDGNRWALDAAETRPQAITADNLYSAEIDRRGVAMWGVSWRQRMALGAFDASTLDDFLRYRETADVAPADGTPDIETAVDLPGPEES